MLDGLRFPVNDVAFDPASPRIAIATGSYDGGWAYEGELVVWDPTTGRVERPLRDNREIVRVRWIDGALVARLRPPDDTSGGDDEGVAVLDGRVEPRALDALHLDGDASEDPTLGAEVLELSRGRRLVRDATWTAVDDVTFTLAGGAIETWSPEGRLLRRVEIPGEPIRILGRWLHALVHDETERLRENGVLWRHARRSALFELASGREHVRLPGTFEIVVARNGAMLARDTSHERSARDRLLDGSGAVRAELDLGGYDPFNHHLGLSGEDALYFLRGASSEAHLKKRVVRLDPTTGDAHDVGRWDGSGAHSMDGHAVAVPGGWLRSHRIWSPRPSVVDRRLEGLGPDWTARWTRTLSDATTAMLALPERGAVVVACADGWTRVVDVQSGRDLAPLDLGVVTALAWSGRVLAVGTLDGRRLLVRDR